MKKKVNFKSLILRKPSENHYCQTCGKRLDICPYKGKHPLNS